MPQKVLKGKKITIAVDNRERGSSTFFHLNAMDNVNISLSNLPIGDYICSDRVVVERKTVGDFVGSIIDGRIFDQVVRMNENYERPVLLIEGNPELLFFERNVHENAIRGAIASLAVDYRIPIVWCRDGEETAMQIYRIAYREQVDVKRDVKIARPKKGEKISYLQELLLCGLPNVNLKTARKMLKFFKTPRNVFNANAELLMRVEGIGKEKSRRILEVLTSEYGGEEV